MKNRLQQLLALKPIRFIADIVYLYFQKHVSRAAAGLAYFLILTFFPILICITAFASMVNVQLSDLLYDLSHLLPESVYGVFQDYLGYLDNNLSTAMLFTGSTLAIFFAASAIRGITAVMHELYGGPRAGPVIRIAASLLFALLLLVTVYLSMIVMLTGGWFFHLVGNALGLSDLALRLGFLQWAKYLVLLCPVFLFVFLLYRFAAPLQPPRPPVIPGALLASAALAIASAVFSLVVSHSTRYSLIYGSLASVIVMLVWFYLCGNILILGNVVNYVLFCHRNGRDV